MKNSVVRCRWKGTATWTESKPLTHDQAVRLAQATAQGQPQLEVEVTGTKMARAIWAIHDRLLARQRARRARSA